MSEAGFLLFDAWSQQSPKYDPDLTRAKWNSLTNPSVGWHQLEAEANRHAGAAFPKGVHDFEAIVGDSGTDGLQGDGSGGDGADGEVDNHVNMFARYAWVESAKRAVDLRTGDLLDQEQFEFRIPPRLVEIPPAAGAKEGARGKVVKTSAWQIFKETTRGRRSYKHLTCRFGGPLEIFETLPDLMGLCLNIWRPPPRKVVSGSGAAGKVSDEDIAPFLRLAELVVPDPGERKHVLDFFAFTVQHQDIKINHALVLGSQHEGVGKDSLLEPFRAAIGRQYFKEINPPQLTATFNRWLVNAKVVSVQEMHTFERRAVSNAVKPLIAAPPAALPVNLKGMQEFFVPNLASMIFCTNEPDAMTVATEDRRLFICWNDDPPAPKAFYDAVWDWYGTGGLDLVVQWLHERDVSKFNAKGQAPATAAKEAMRKETRPLLEAWVEDAIAAQDAPFNSDLILPDDVRACVPTWAKYKGQDVSPQRLAKALTRAGAKPVSVKMRLPNIDGPRVIWACRRAEMYAGEPPEGVRTLFFEQRARAAAALDGN